MFQFIFVLIQIARLYSKKLWVASAWLINWRIIMKFIMLVFYYTLFIFKIKDNLKHWDQIIATILAFSWKSQTFIWSSNFAFITIGLNKLFCILWLKSNDECLHSIQRIGWYFFIVIEQITEITKWLIFSNLWL